MTEPAVKAILGEPKNVEDKIKPIRGGREFVEIRVVSYGSAEGQRLSPGTGALRVAERDAMRTFAIANQKGER